MSKKEVVGTFIAMLLVVALYFVILQDVFFEEGVLFSPGGGETNMSYMFVWIIIGVFVIAIIALVLVIIYIGKKQAKGYHDLTGYKDIPGNPYVG